MAKPSEFQSVLITSYAIVLTNYLLLGAVGYAMFGEGTQHEVSMNLGRNWVATVAIAIIVSVSCVTVSI
jgi:amino acid permease